MHVPTWVYMRHLHVGVRETLKKAYITGETGGWEPYNMDAEYRTQVFYMSSLELECWDTLPIPMEFF